MLHLCVMAHGLQQSFVSCGKNDIKDIKFCRIIETACDWDASVKTQLFTENNATMELLALDFWRRDEMTEHPKITIDGIQYSGATVAFLGSTHRFLCSYGVLHGNSDFLMFKHLKRF